MYIRSHCTNHQNPSLLQIPLRVKCSLHASSQDHPTWPSSVSPTSPPAPLLSPCSRHTGLLLAILTYTRHIFGSSFSYNLRTSGVRLEWKICVLIWHVSCKRCFVFFLINCVNFRLIQTTQVYCKRTESPFMGSVVICSKNTKNYFLKLAWLL